MSWTPNDFKSLIKGAQHRQIDDYERMAKQAMFNRYAQNAKRANEKKMFNAKQARRNLELGIKNNDKEIERMIAINRTLKDWKPQFIPKKKGVKQ